MEVIDAKRLGDPTAFPGKRMVPIQELIDKHPGGMPGWTEPPPPGVRTGYETLDRKFLNGGMRPEQLFILAARPGIGKTSFALNLADNIAQQNKRVFIFSLEMGYEELLMRMACARSGVNHSLYQLGELDDHEKKRLLEAFTALRELQICVDDKTDLDPDAIEKELKAHKDRGTLPALVIIDYLQLMVASDNRYAEVCRLSRGMKMLAKKFGIPFLVLSQLNRKSEERSDKAPQLSDLRDSGAIEQDADAVWFLFEVESDSPDYQRIDLGVAKNRGGQRGRLPLRFEGQFMRFSEAEHKPDISFSATAASTGADEDFN